MMIMQMRLQTVFLILLMMFNVTVSAAPQKNKNNSENKMSPDTIYTESKQNILVSAKQPEFMIKLKSNPTTGFSWFLREFNSNLIVPVKHRFLPPIQQLVGASGYEEWTFKVKAAAFVVPQQTTIRMMYARPWNTNDNATQLIFRVSTQK